MIRVFKLKIKGLVSSTLMLGETRKKSMVEQVVITLSKGLSTSLLVGRLPSNAHVQPIRHQVSGYRTKRFNLIKI